MDFPQAKKHPRSTCHPPQHRAWWEMSSFSCFPCTGKISACCCQLIKFTRSSCSKTQYPDFFKTLEIITGNIYDRSLCTTFFFYSMLVYAPQFINTHIPYLLVNFRFSFQWEECRPDKDVTYHFFTLLHLYYPSIQLTIKSCHLTTAVQRDGSINDKYR